MIKVALVRGAYLNNFEGQNYIFNPRKIQLTAVSSLFPIHNKPAFPIIKLLSLVDLPFKKFIKFIANRTLGDSQVLFGIEKLADNFDIFHTADSHYYYSYQLAKLRAIGKIKALISTSWETIPFNNEGTLMKQSIKTFARSNMDLFICYTNRARECLIKEGVNKNKIKVVRLGVDLKRFTESDRHSGKRSASRIDRPWTSQDDVKILFVGRQVEEKGINDYLAIKNSIKTKNLKLKIVSDASYDDMPRIYQQADILVVPSKRTKTWEEQYGMVLVEAMASGLPIIAYDTGAIAEVLGEAGILIKPNVTELSRSIDRLIKDRNLRRKLGTIARRRAEKFFDARDTAKQLVKIYETISHNSDKRGRESK